MAWWRRWFGRQSAAERQLATWRAEWSAAIAEPGHEAVAALRARLDGLGLPPEEIELEEEMVEGLAALAALVPAPIPVVETGHRAIGTETCHFSAPVFMPEEPSQPGGRLLFTGSRAVFVGGGRPTIIPWHAVGDVRQAARDVLLLRVDRERLFRFRANSYADALCGAHLARRLARRPDAPSRNGSAGVNDKRPQQQ